MKLKINKKEELEKLDYLFQSTDLCEIMGRNKSDKGHKDLTRTHNYTTIYHKLFNKLRDLPINLFELGLGTNNENFLSNMTKNGRPGASLYGWSEFFVNANIFGAEIDKGVLFETDRIKTFYCDQTNPDVIRDMWSNDKLKNIEFDIIIEDGLHSTPAQICFFKNSIHKVKAGGYYIIEDFNHGNHFLRLCNEFQKIQNDEIYRNLSVEINQLPATSAHHKSNGNNGLVIIKKN